MSRQSSTSASKWTLRRIQFGVFMLVLLIMLIQAVITSMDREKRAEKLYEDSWFAGYNLTFIPFYYGLNEDEQRKTGIKLLQKALDLSPGNSIYEQALAWRYPADQIPKLLSERKLGDKARTLAEYRYYKYEYEALRKRTDNIFWAEMNKTGHAEMNPATSGFYYPKEYWRDCFNLLDGLTASDPHNARVYYQRARIYGDMGQYDKMMSLIRKANAIDTFIDPQPEHSPKVQGTYVEMFIYSLFDNGFSHGLPRTLRNYGNQLLRDRKADEAMRVYEDCCQMGIRFAMQKPLNENHFSRGYSIFKTGWQELEPIYKDFGRSSQLKKYQRLSDGFRDGMLINRYNFDKQFSKSLPLHLMIGLFQSLVIIGIGICLSALSWLIFAFAGRRKNRNAVLYQAWYEGRLLRNFLIIYLAVAVIVILAARVWPNMIFDTYSMMVMYDTAFFDNMAAIGVILMQTIVIIVAICQLRRRYSEYIGKKTGIWRFIFAVPIEVRAWACRSFTQMYVAQMLFLIFLIMISAISLQATLGIYPWQPERIKIHDVGSERNTINKAARVLENAAGFLTK